MSPTGQKGERRDETLRPLTCGQLAKALKEADGADMMIDGAELSDAVLVGCVSGRHDEPTHANFILNDGSGAVPVKAWSNAQDSTVSAMEEFNAWRDGSYVKVWGAVRSYGSDRSFTPYRIRVIESFDEVTAHLAESIYIHLYLTKGPLAASKPKAVNSGGGLGGFDVGVGGHDDDISNMSPEQQTVLKAFRELGGGDSGATVAAVASKLAGQMSSERVRSITDELAAEGQLYSTVDEEHYKSTL
jgi:replication factor A2